MAIVACIYITNTSIYMGNRKYHNEFGDQQPLNGSEAFYGPASYRDSIIGYRPLQKIKRKEVMLFIGDILGLSGILSGLLTNLEDWKGKVVFFVCMFYIVGRVVILFIQAGRMFIKFWKELIELREFKASNKKPKK